MLLKFIKWPFIKLLDLLELYAPLVLRNGPLKDDGWFNSFRSKSPVDRHGNPLPWMPYPFIDFIVSRLNVDMNILEFGSGNSTLFFSKRVNHVTAVEHDINWFNKIQSSMPCNVTINHIDFYEGGNYSKFASSKKNMYNVIIVDGRDRNNCIANSINALTKDGIIILDDSERRKYSEGKQYLISREFNEIDFWGIAPGQTYKKCTSLFYRQINCFGL